MGKFSMKNANYEDLEIDVIRYFENDNSEYLIYSLNETVGDDYIKLYASKIIGNTAKIISEENEWLLVKDMVKKIIKANHEGLELEINDLNEEELENIALLDTRIFKLQGNLVNLLSVNKKKSQTNLDELIEETEEIFEEVQKIIEEQLEADSEDANEVEYELNKSIAEYSSDKSDCLEEANTTENEIINTDMEKKIKDLENEIETYKTKLEKITCILND